jgi:hypothetical protein
MIVLLLPVTSWTYVIEVEVYVRLRCKSEMKVIVIVVTFSSMVEWMCGMFFQGLFELRVAGLVVLNRAVSYAWIFKKWLKIKRI